MFRTEHVRPSNWKGALAISVMLLVSPSFPLEAAPQFLEQVAKDNSNAIVFLKTKAVLPSGEVVESTGTGFLLNKHGYVLTASHILSPEGVYDRAEAFGSPKTRYGHLWPLDVISDDSRADLLLLKFKEVGNEWTSVSLGSPNDTPVGDTLAVLGFPLGYDLGAKRGELSNKNGSGGSWAVTVPLNKGDSGAPVFDSSGRVVAMVVGGVGEAENLAFCLPLNFGISMIKIAGESLGDPTSGFWSSPPQTLKPLDGVLLTSFPRALELDWTEVEGARSYKVQLQIQDPIDSAWHPHPFGFGERVVRASNMELEFVGSQPGRWRVAAINQVGEETDFSNWMHFSFEDSIVPLPIRKQLPYQPRLVLRYRYTHQGQRCDAFFIGDGQGNWMEVSLGDDKGCLETAYTFQQTARNGDTVEIYDSARGYRVKLPVEGGWVTLSTSPEGDFHNIHRVERIH